MGKMKMSTSINVARSEYAWTKYVWPTDSSSTIHTRRCMPLHI